ncbi:hypothetical protein IAU60_000242 [Kwoniella sp. DSM 27419]
MAFPASVERLPLARTRRGGRRRAEEAERALFEASVSGTAGQPRAGGVGGVGLDFGRDGGAVLEKSKKGWKWTWASEDRRDVRLEPGGGATCLFPATRALDPAPAPLSITDSIDAATLFVEAMCEPYERYGLREALSAIIGDDVPAEAGPSHTSKQPARATTRQNGPYDVYQGPVLAIITNSRARLARTSLAFPTGEVGHHLNVSPFLPVNGRRVNARERLRFAPTGKPVERFPTPILQIVSSPIVSSARVDREATALLIRLQSNTHILNLVPDHSYLPTRTFSPIRSERIAQLSYEDTDGRRHMDAALDAGTWSRVLVVDEGGAVWLWWEEKEVRGGHPEKIWNLRKVRDAVTSAKHTFFRVAFGTKPGTAIVISAKDATIIDIDDPSHPSTLLMTLQEAGHEFTSLEKTALERLSAYTALCTTREIIWLQDAKPGSAALSWKHGLLDTQGLEVTAVVGHGHRDSCMILSGPSQRHLLAFATTGPGTLRALSAPYAIPLPMDGLSSLIPFTPASSHQSRSLLAIASDGSLHSIPVISTAHARQIADGTRRPPHLFKGGLVDDADLVKPIVDADEEGTSGREMAFRWAWLFINQPSTAQDEDRCFSPLEMEGHLREMDAPLEHLMTAADLARDSVYSEPPMLRSHLLAPLPLHPEGIRTTLRALGDVTPGKHLHVEGRWCDAVPAYGDARPRLFISEDALDLSVASVAHEQLLERFPPVPANRARQRLHTAQLVVDLALSRIILSSDPVPSPTAVHAQAAVETETVSDEPDELFARAAGQLSLQDRQAPPIRYSFLIAREPATEEDEAGDGDGEGDVVKKRIDLQNPSARALMSDWTLGDDPTRWEWRTWRRDGEDSGDGSARLGGRSRPIRPLPSPRKVQRSTFAQSASPGVLGMTTGSLSQSSTHPLQPTFSLPSLRTLPPSLGTESFESPKTGHAGTTRMQRSSPPPVVYGSSQPEETQWAATQVERGPHGGREKKKKAVKKRVGGF